MNVTYIKEVCSNMHEFMNSNGFSTAGQDTGIFKGTEKQYKVSYNDSAKQFVLSVTNIPDEGEEAVYSAVTSWLFDENDHGANDTKCIAEDFVSAVAEANGIKIVTTPAGNIEQVVMPEKAAEGADPGIEAFTQKFLAMFPQYKEDYKLSIATYGDFLYVDFFKKYGVQKLRELTDAENKKQLTKYWNMLGDMHYEGEALVGDIICAVIIAGTFGQNPAEFDNAAAKYLTDYPFLKQAGAAAAKNYKSNKKLRKVLEV
jgi:hypothetical protein